MANRGPPPAAFALFSKGNNAEKDDACVTPSEEKVTHSHMQSSLPIFDVKEIGLGSILGTGSFCTVKSIDDIFLNKIKNTENNTSAENNDTVQNEARERFANEFMEYNKNKNGKNGKPRRSSFLLERDLAEDPTKKPPPRYALKQLRHDLSNYNSEQGDKDLETEMNILIHVQTSSSPFGAHPNIIGLHAISDYCEKPRFLVLDRLKSTLKKRLYKWREARGVGLFDFLAIQQKESRRLWLERIMVLAKISGALLHLHKNDILYRDVKPDNIGFDFDDSPKIFDFGLSRKLDSSCHQIDGLYRLTGETGSRRYMSPEVALNQPYGKTADVYSLSILMYEVLSLKIPYSEVSMSKFQKQVMEGNKRPILDLSWPLGLRNLMQGMWDRDCRNRIGMEGVVGFLEGMLRGSDEALFPVPPVKSLFRSKR